MLVSESAKQSARQALYQKYDNRFEINGALNRSLVSYQSNRKRPYYRWLKYKEGFSARLVEYVLDRFAINSGRLLDPFAGSGVSVLVGAERGLQSSGIELLPVGVKALEARMAAEKVSADRMSVLLSAFRAGDWKSASNPTTSFSHLNITKGAFPVQQERKLNQFRAFLAIANLEPCERTLLEVACVNILESISFTRKDGQYLRWDHRAPRDLKGKSFDKGRILTFEEAMSQQLNWMYCDLATPELFATHRTDLSRFAEITLGSCLDILPTLKESGYETVITSPPYCNRYDYTRTYALELAFLGVDEEQLKYLRQELLSCTVENKSKLSELEKKYSGRKKVTLFSEAQCAFENQDALHEILDFLEHMAKEKKLNNSNIARMVRNYFLEMSIVIFELGRVVGNGGRVVMINDNVQYAGEEVPVDLILCDLASKAGFTTEAIWVLARGKGNSSQQMGRHGRNELRKCAYIWRRD